MKEPSEYWIINAECALDAAGVEATSEQIKQIARSIEMGHEDYGFQHGHHEADKSLRAMQKKEAQEMVMNFVEKLFADLDCGPSFFDHMSDDQKWALARIQHIRQEFPKQQRSN